MSVAEHNRRHPAHHRAEAPRTIGESPEKKGDELAFPPISTPRRIVYLAIAGVCFALGMLGVILPGLPTTPFLLVTSALLFRSWPAMHQRMMRSRFIGGLLCDWRRHRGIRPHVKVRAITLVVALVAATIYFGALSTTAAAVTILCAGIGIVVILALPTIRPS
jgi:uncharacterized membrane protein YbaN (DUF454 family)